MVWADSLATPAEVRSRNGDVTPGSSPAFRTLVSYLDRQFSPALRYRALLGNAAIAIKRAPRKTNWALRAGLNIGRRYPPL